MKLFAVTILAGASSAAASPARQAVGATTAAKTAERGWAGYVDTSIKPRLIGQRPAAGNSVGGETKGGKMRELEVDDEEDYRPQSRRQERSLSADLASFDAMRALSADQASFDAVLQQLERMPNAEPAQPVATKPGTAQAMRVALKPGRVLGLTDKQLAELAPIDMSEPMIDLRVKALPDEIVVRPRRLANARPACGNTGGKDDDDRPAADCSLADRALALELDKWEIQQANKREAKRVEKANRDAHVLFAAVMSILSADPSLQARLLVNGRPACGNTQGKTSSTNYCIGDVQ